MKKILSIILASVMLLPLAACGQKGESTQTETVPGVDPATGQWIGAGGCYTLAAAELPENAVWTCLLDGERYSLIQDLTKFETYFVRGDETLWQADNPAYMAAAVSDGVWIAQEAREDGRERIDFTLLSLQGEERKTLSVRLPADCFARDFAVTDGLLVLNCSDRLLAYDQAGQEISQIPHAEWSGSMVSGSDGKLYFTQPRETGGGTVSTVDARAGQMTECFVYERGSLCTGDEAAPLLLLRSDGIYRVQADGEKSPLVLWEECGLTVTGLSGAEALPDGQYLLVGQAVAPMLLLPAEPSELKPRTVLTLAVLPYEDRMADYTLQFGNLIAAVNAFNARSLDCSVSIQDLSEDGTLTREQALTKLSTRLIAGEGPDMLLFRGELSPFPYLRKGLLRDLRQDVEADPELSLEDILTADAIVRDLGGLYLLSDRFTMDTRVGLQSRFGECWGWRFDEYLALDRERPEGTMVMYNLTREYFLRMSATRYMRSAIDWQSGSCAFDTPEFIRILNACREMRETPEDPENMVFGLGWDLLQGGYLMTDAIFLSSAAQLSAYRQQAGEAVSVIGWPTTDGSCGTDFSLGDPIGVLNSSAHPEACWQFLKAMLTGYEGGTPAYHPAMEAQIALARSHTEDSEPLPFAENLKGPISEADEQQFRELLRQVEHTSLYDEAVLEIIQQECAAFLAGQRSAEDTAALIQSRVSLYVAEQAG